MTTINLIKGNFIKIYSNKSFDIFKQGGKLVLEENNLNGIYGVVYDDFNPNMEIVNSWKKEYPEMKIFHVATRKKTVCMDDKKDFYQIMGNSKYTPDSYLSYEDIPNTTNSEELFFVKKVGGSGSKGVNVYKYCNLSAVNTNNCVIQKSMKKPDLYNNKRYKMRVYVILHNNNVYYFKNNWTSTSTIDYYSDCDNLREKNIIYQKENTIWILSRELDNFELIEKNVILAIEDFKKFYLKDIENINKNEFVILGFDFVVDNEKNVHIIEINHRSNYAHPDDISKKTDVLCMRDLIKLLINGTHQNTDLLLIS